MLCLHSNKLYKCWNIYPLENFNDQLEAKYSINLGSFCLTLSLTYSVWMLMSDRLSCSTGRVMYTNQNWAVSTFLDDLSTSYNDAQFYYIYISISIILANIWSASIISPVMYPARIFPSRCFSILDLPCNRPWRTSIFIVYCFNLL